MSDGDGCRRARVHIHIRETLMHSRCGAGNPAPTHQLPPLLPCSMCAEPPHQPPPALRATADGYDFAPRSPSMSACVRGRPLSRVPAPIRSSCSHLILTCAHPIHAHPHTSPPAVGSASALCPRPPTSMGRAPHCNLCWAKVERARRHAKDRQAPLLGLYHRFTAGTTSQSFSSASTVTTELPRMTTIPRSFVSLADT